jgi:hypothetical protein
MPTTDVASAHDALVARLRRDQYRPTFRSDQAPLLFVAGAVAGIFGWSTVLYYQQDSRGLWWFFAIPAVAAIFGAYRVRAALRREAEEFAQGVRRTWAGLREDPETGMPAELTADERLEAVKVAIEMLPRRKRAELQPWISELFDARGSYTEGHKGHRPLEKGFPLF